MPIAARYLHTNLTVRDFDRMVSFYETVFGCRRIREPQRLQGPWLDDITRIDGAKLRYVHLRFPGWGDEGPELEINSYENPMEQRPPKADRCGFGHVSFAVEDVEAALVAVEASGGSRLGKIARAAIPGRGVLTEVYATDPEGNILELQHYAS